MNIKEIVSNLMISDEWNDMIMKSTITPLVGGMSGIKTYKLMNIQNNLSYVLKIANSIEKLTTSNMRC